MCFLPSIGSSQLGRHPFTSPLHPWGFSDTKTFDSYPGWMSSSSLVNTPRNMCPPSPVNLLYPTGSSMDTGSLSPSTGNTFQPQHHQQQHLTSPGRDNNMGSPEPGSRGGTGSVTSEAGSAGTEYSPDSKPVKSELSDVIISSSSSQMSSTNCFTSSYSLPTTPQTHPLPTYPYMGSADYGSALFHPANMFKAATLARVSKKRSSTGKAVYHWYI